MNRKIVVGLIALLLPSALVGQDKAAIALNRLSNTIGALGSYQVGFVADVGGYVVEGNYVVMDSRYKIVVGMDIDEPASLDYEIICDGKVRYEINHNDQEVMIDNINPNDRNILTNPTKAFDFASDSFKATMEQPRTIDGKLCDVLLLTPMQRGTPFGAIILAIDQIRGLPVQLRYKVEGVEGDVIVLVRSFVSNRTISTAQFEFHRANYPQYELVDFR